MSIPSLIACLQGTENIDTGNIPISSPGHHLRQSTPATMTTGAQLMQCSLPAVSCQRRCYSFACMLAVWVWLNLEYYICQEQLSPRNRLLHSLLQRDMFVSGAKSSSLHRRSSDTNMLATGTSTGSLAPCQAAPVARQQAARGLPAASCVTARYDLLTKHCVLLTSWLHLLRLLSLIILAFMYVYSRMQAPCASQLS